MNDLSLYILDIIENSLKAKSKVISLEINETDDIINISITDDGTGMTKDEIGKSFSPFYTNNKKANNKKVGLGIPFFKEQCEITGGSFNIISEKNYGTKITGILNKNSIDILPMGDLPKTIMSVITFDNIDFNFKYQYKDKIFELKTEKLKEILDGFSLQKPQVQKWILEYVTESLQLL